MFLWDFKFSQKSFSMAVNSPAVQYSHVTGVIRGGQGAGGDRHPKVCPSTLCMWAPKIIHPPTTFWVQAHPVIYV